MLINEFKYSIFRGLNELKNLDNIANNKMVDEIKETLLGKFLHGYYDKIVTERTYNKQKTLINEDLYFKDILCLLKGLKEIEKKGINLKIDILEYNLNKIPNDSYIIWIGTSKESYFGRHDLKNFKYDFVEVASEYNIEKEIYDNLLSGLNK